MPQDWRLLMRRRGGGHGWQVQVTLGQHFTGKIFAGYSQQPPAWLDSCQPIIRQASPFGKRPEEGALLLREDLGEERETDKQGTSLLPISLQTCKWSPCGVSPFCLVLSLSRLWTMEATMVLSKWFHRLLFRHSTFNISILSFCFHTKGALLQYNVLRIMSMSSNGF